MQSVWIYDLCRSNVQCVYVCKNGLLFDFVYLYIKWFQNVCVCVCRSWDIFECRKSDADADDAKYETRECGNAETKHNEVSCDEASSIAIRNNMSNDSM